MLNTCNYCTNYKIEHCHNPTDVLFGLFSLFLKGFIYLPLERGEGRWRERERNTNVWLPLARLTWGPSPKPRPVPQLGIKLVTLWFAGWRSIH